MSGPLLALALGWVLLAAPAQVDAQLGGRDSLGSRLAQGWDDLSPRERGEARRNYERFQRLQPEQRRAVERNYERWRRLPNGEKERIRSNYQRYQRMSPQERREFDERYERWRDR